LGATIKAVGSTDDGWPLLVVEKDECTTQLEVGCDLEGNGPGFIHGLAWVDPKQTPMA
jgi:hypothetical protein